jgi:hypothetical protein
MEIYMKLFKKEIVTDGQLLALICIWAASFFGAYIANSFAPIGVTVVSQIVFLAYMVYAGRKKKTR